MFCIKMLCSAAGYSLHLEDEHQAVWLEWRLQQMIIKIGEVCKTAMNSQETCKLHTWTPLEFTFCSRNSETEPPKIWQVLVFVWQSWNKTRSCLWQWRCSCKTLRNLAKPHHTSCTKSLRAPRRTVNLPASLARLWRGAQIPGAKSPWRLHFVRWCLIFVDPQYGTCFMSPFWRLEFWGVSDFFGKFVHP